MAGRPMQSLAPCWIRCVGRLWLWARLQAPIRAVQHPLAHELQLATLGAALSVMQLQAWMKLEWRRCWTGAQA